MVRSPVIVSRTSPEGLAPEEDPDSFGEYLVISAAARSGGRQEDVQNEFNLFETGLM